MDQTTGRALQLLVVEDNPGDVEIFRAALGYGPPAAVDFETVGSLDEAMGCLERGGIDAVLLDLDLPDSSGADTFYRVHTRHPAVPIVVLTGVEDDELGLELVAQGAQDYLSKSEVGRAALFRCLRYSMARQQIQNELREAQEKADAAAKAQSIFISSMSHEIRTPLTAILGMADLLLETHLDEEQEGYVKSLHRCGRSLLAILNNVLELSRVESGRVEIHPVTFSVRDVVEQTVGTFAYAAEKKDVTLCCDVAFDVPRCIVADSDRIRQILGNLLANALKFTSRGHVLVRVTRGEESEPREGELNLRFAVSDTGIGIDEEDARWIFERFAQANVLVTRKFGGSGLGLAICKELVEAMNGTISARGEPGKGSTFALELPVGVVKEEGETSAAANALAGHEVLVVDEADVERSLVAKWLRHFGARVSEAANGMEALRLLEARDEPLDAVVLDARMPGRGGLEVLGALREAGLGRTRVVMMLPAAHRSGDLRRCRKLRVDPVLKPLSADSLLAALSPDAQESPVARASCEKRFLEGMRVLVVDDSEENRTIIMAFLSRSGCEVDPVDNGAEAVSAARSGNYDLVLMDMRMPVLDGYEATRVIRRLEEREGRPRVPILALTAYAFQEQARSCLAAGCDGHVAKPIDRTALCEAVAAYARHRPGPESGLRVQPDPEIADLVPGYLDNRRRDVASLEQALAGGDLDTVAHLAHNMKGTGAGYGLPWVSELGAELERAAREGDVESAREGVERLAALVAEVEVAPPGADASGDRTHG